MRLRFFAADPEHPFGEKCHAESPRSRVSVIQPEHEELDRLVCRDRDHQFLLDSSTSMQVSRIPLSMLNPVFARIAAYAAQGRESFASFLVAEVDGFARHI